MSLSRDNKPDEELYQACLNGDTATVSISRFDSALFLQGVPDHEIEGICRLFCKWLTIMVRKHVIGPPAEHNGRRIEHLAPHIASFVAPTKYVRPLASDDDSLRDSDSEDELYYIDY